MKEIKLHNGKLAKLASLKEIDKSIKWFEQKLASKEYRELSYMESLFILLNDNYEQLRAYRSDRMNKNLKND